MGVYEPDDALRNDRAFQLVRNTFVVMFWSEEVLTETVTWLTRHGYGVVDVDAGRSADGVALLDELARALNFPDYFGRNLDAFDDGLRDVVSGDYGADRDATGFVLVLRHYDAFARRDRQFAHRVVDIVAGQCRNGALIGHRMMCLVQSDDPHLELPPVGSAPVSWNDAEWLDTSRGG